MSGGELSVNIIRHLCGKLIDYASVCQQGKSKIHAAWRYLKFGPDLWPSVRAKMIEDLMWWETKLILWSTGSSDGCYPFVNTSTLLDNLDAVGILVSDYSGSDVCGGFGGLSGTLLSTNPRYFALQHSLPQERVSSFVGELRVFRHQLRQDLDRLGSVLSKDMSSLYHIREQIYIPTDDSRYMAGTDMENRVEPPPTEVEGDGFDRQRCIVGFNQTLVESQMCLVLGTGGVGQNVGLVLARLGVRGITLVDKDIYEASNFSRQVLGSVKDIGRRKVDVAVENLPFHCF